ncbi:MAG: hypothetical protein NVSMB32_16230 [Actinomycetota bacterium]
MPAMGGAEEEAHELALSGDGVTPGIVRVGDTVRRPVRPFTGTVHGYLAHLRGAGFEDAPLPLGIDEQGREVLSFVPGDVPRQPLPWECATEDVLVALARLLRRLHDAAQGWVTPPDAIWGRLPGVNRPFEAPAELVGHNDYCPGNVVFRGGLPAALIDFDLARPTTRLDEVANALYWWAPLLDPMDRAPGFVDLDIPGRVAIFASAYGLGADERQGLVPLLRRRARWSHQWAKSAAEADPLFRQFWEQGSKDRMPRAEAWIEREGPAIVRRLRGRPYASRRP